MTIAAPSIEAACIWRQPVEDAQLPFAVELQRSDGSVLIGFHPNFDGALDTLRKYARRLRTPTDIRRAHAIADWNRAEART